MLICNTILQSENLTLVDVLCMENEYGEMIDSKLMIDGYASYLYHWRRKWQPTPVLTPGKSHEWMSLVGCSSWGRKESDPTEQLHFTPYFITGEGNGNPLQYS